MKKCQPFFTAGEQKLSNIFSYVSQLIAFQVQFMALKTPNLNLLIREYDESEASTLEKKALFEPYNSTPNNRYLKKTNKSVIFYICVNSKWETSSCRKR